jgi:hypothetical protein
MLRSRPIILAVAVVAFFLILANLYGDLPLEYYRNYNPGEGALPNVALQNDTPQPGYFKHQPEWNWKIPSRGKNWDGYARKPANRDIVVLTASDGGGHNSAIPNVLERGLENRREYCEKHGYQSLWLNTSRYDIGDAHRVSHHKYSVPGIAGAPPY